MAQFRFPMQRLLDHRLQEERRRQRMVAELEAERRTLEHQMIERQRSIRGAKEHLREMLSGAGVRSERARSGSVDVTSARREMHASLAQEASLREAALRLAGVHRRLSEARASLLEATTARRAVELLRDRRYEQWRRAEAKAEGRLLDELGARSLEDGT